MANDFSGDPSCKALWRFEPGALIADSIGANTLTNNNGVASDTTPGDFWEGAGSALFARSSDTSFSILDAALIATGFPFNSTDTVMQGTFCFWLKLTSIDSDASIFYKDWDGNHGFDFSSSSGGGAGPAYIAWGPYFQYINLSGPLIVNHVYHCSIGIDGVNKILNVRIWDYTTSSWFCNETFNPTDSLLMSTGPLVISNVNGSYGINGNIDEFVVFNRLLSETEAQSIMAGTYGEVVVGTGSITLPAMTADGDGSVIESAVGTGAITLPKLILSGSGTITEATTGVGAITLPQIQVNGVGQIIPAVIVGGPVGLRLGTIMDVTSSLMQPVVVPGEAGLILRVADTLVSVLPKPVVIPGTVGLILRVSLGLTGGALPVPIVIPCFSRLLLRSKLGLVSNLIEPVVVPGEARLILKVQLFPETGEDLETWVLTGQGFNPSAYSGWPFKSFALYQGQYYGATDDGLYLLEGQDQNGGKIRPGVRIGWVNFSTDRQKRLRSIRVSEAGRDVQVRIVASRNGKCRREGFFTLEGDRIVVSHDLQGQEFLIDLQEFDELSQVEITPLILVTK